jgi:cellulose biosynthesis protein BcsQ
MRKVSFFSYKGGSCRSTTAWNTTYFLAEKWNANKDYPLIVIDADIDSAGLSILMNKAQSFTVQDLMLEYKGKGEEIRKKLISTGTVKDHPFFSRLVPVGKEFGREEAEAVLLLPARVSDNCEEFKCTNDMVLNLIKDIETLCNKTACRGIVFDTPAGTQMFATICLERSNVIVCCMRPTDQFRVGTKRFIEKTFADKSRFKFILCPTAVPKNKVKVDTWNMPDDLSGCLKDDVLEKIKNNYPDFADCIIEKMILNDDSILGIPEVALFKWKESCLGRDGADSDDQELALRSYEYLADLINERCG